MSLDTVLKIGKAFRNSENGLKHFKYIKKCPLNTEKDFILRLYLPLKEDFTFDLENITEISDENIIGSNTLESKLYYLRFKTSDSDGSPVKYLFGDIFYDIIQNKENSFKTSVDKQSSSFLNWETYLNKELIEKLSKSKIKEEEKKYLESTAMNSFRAHPIIKIFREKFLEFEYQLESLLYYGLGIEKLLSSGTYNQEILKQPEILRELTAEEIFKSILSEKNAKKKLKDLFGSEDISWNEIKPSSDLINKLYKIYTYKVFVHFDFSKTNTGKKYWYDFEDIIAIIERIFLESFTEKSIQGLVFNKTLYKTLCSGDAKNDIQFPDFQISAKHKSKAFTKDEISDLFYAIDYSKKAAINPTEDVKLIVLPYGENLTAQDYESFSKETDLLVAEAIANRNNKQDDILFSWFDEEDGQDSRVAHFDMIFSKKGGLTSPDTDLVELSGIKKSSLQEIKKRIRKIQHEIYNKRQKELRVTVELKPLSISWSFTNILGSSQTDRNGKVIFKTNPKYQSHLIKVLPQIYTSCYLDDSMLLPAFIEKTEYSIRQGDSRFNFLKYDLEFLMSIQNTTIYKQNFNKIMGSKSYELGKNLGRLALFLKPDKNGDSPINSFEKEYVGNLSRHIGQLRDVQKFCSYLFEKYALHKEKANFIPFDVKNGTITRNVEDILLILLDSNNKVAYDKNECAFGFFTSYFAPYDSAKKDDTHQIESVEN